MYSVHVTSNHDKKSSNKRLNQHRAHRRKPLIQISNFNQLICCIRDNMFNLCSSQSTALEREFNEFDNTFVSAKPENIDLLCEQTNFSKRELKIMYREFKNECPDGILKEEIFQNIYKNFFPKGSETKNYAHLVFSTFDTEQKGEITFTDFIFSLSVLMRGKAQEKLNSIFKLYDTKKKGFLEKDDFKCILSAIYEMTNNLNSKAICNQIDEKKHLEHVFQKFDINQTGCITLKDFVKTCREDERIINSLNAMNTII